MALYYDQGDGVQADKKKAADFYEESMRADDSFSAARLRSIYIESLSATVLSYVNFRAEESGRPANYYERSFSADYSGISAERAFSYLISNAESDEDCKNAAAACLFFGIGATKDEEKAFSLGFSPIPDEKYMSDEDFSSMRDEYLKNRADEERRLWEKAKSEQSAEAYFELFEFYDGIYTTLDADSRCFELLKIAAEKDYAPALRELARFYQDGKSCAFDPLRAEKYLRKAASLGDSLAQAELAECCLQGFGTEYDFDAAIEWLVLSARGGNNSAALKLRQFGYGSLIDSKNPEMIEADFAEEMIGDEISTDFDDGLSESISSDEVDSNAENDFSDAGIFENQLLLLGEPTIISLKNHAAYQIGLRSSVVECAATFWSSILGGISDEWKNCVALDADGKIILEGDEIRAQTSLLENIISLARAEGNLDGIEIHIFFSAAHSEDSRVKVPAALFSDGTADGIYEMTFWQDSDGIWYLLF